MSDPFPFTCKLIEPGIVSNNVLDAAVADVEMLQAIKEENLKLTGGNPYCVLLETDEFTVILDKEKGLAGKELYVLNTLAKALLVKGWINSIKCTIYLLINKPDIEVRVFTSKEAAINWLRKVYFQKMVKSSNLK